MVYLYRIITYNKSKCHMDLRKLHLHWGTCTHKGKKYRSYSLARAYRENGKNRKKIEIPLGKLSDEEVTGWRSFLKAIKKPDYVLTSLDDIRVEKHYSYLDVAVLNEIWNELGLNKLFDSQGRRTVPLGIVAKILSLNRCNQPASKSKTPEWFKETALPWILGVSPDEINPSRIFRELEAIEDRKDKITAYLFEKYAKNTAGSGKSIFYDLSSVSFEGNKCKLMKWGHCKEGYKNHVVLALLVNKCGYPVYWDVLPGGTADATTITWLLSRLEAKFGLKKTGGITFVFDRGMVSDKNLSLLEAKKIKYISTMDKNQIESVTGEDFFKTTGDNFGEEFQRDDFLKDFVEINENTFAKEIKTVGKRRYILCFNPVLFADQQKARDRALANFRISIENLNGVLLCAKRSRKRKPTLAKFEKEIKRFKIESFAKVDLRIKRITMQGKKGQYKIRSYQGALINDDKKKKAVGRKDGFWVLVTNHSEKEGVDFKMSTSEAIRPYREKEIVEEAFRNLNPCLPLNNANHYENSMLQI